ncbi:MAG: DUF3034 family protein [Kiritimatiellae bacterium]|nr:DUF3034 family protein [Kiritimatiellia bacterium]
MNKNQAKNSVRTAFSSLAAVVVGVGIHSAAYGGVPLNNLQGTGGIAFNPLAYTAGLPWDGAEGGDSTNAVAHSALNGKVSRPQIGAWYVNLNDAGINWWTTSAALSFFDHVELSAGYEFINAHKYGDKSINKYNLGAKVKFLDENAFDTSWVPALAVGGVYKYTDSRTVEALGLDDDGFDAYVVASKLITQTPVPVLLSAGLLLSDEVVNGVVGHNDYDVVAFGNIDILPAENIAIGLEYKQGVDAGDGIRNHDYYDAHVAWFVTKQLTLVAAFAETGDKDKFYRKGSTKNLGVGSGAVFSIQYQF